MKKQQFKMGVFECLCCTQSMPVPSTDAGPGDNSHTRSVKLLVYLLDSGANSCLHWTRCIFVSTLCRIHPVHVL